MTPGIQQPLFSMPGDDQLIDLRKLFRAIMRYKWGIAGLAFVFALAAALLVYSMEPVYRASASVVLESKQANVVNVEDVYSVDTYHYNYNQTQYEILKSRSLAERVVRKLNLQNHRAFAPPEQPGDEQAGGFDLRSLWPGARKEPPVELSAGEKEERLIQSITGRVASDRKSVV